MEAKGLYISQILNWLRFVVTDSIERANSLYFFCSPSLGGSGFGVGNLKESVMH